MSDCKTQDSENQKENRKSRIPLWGKIVLAVLAFLVLIVLLLNFLLLGPGMSSLVPAQAAPEEFSTLSGIAGKVSQVLVGDSDPKPEKTVLSLSPDELNTLINNGIRFYDHDRKNNPQNPVILAHWENGGIRVMISKKLLFNRALNVGFFVVPRIVQNHAPSVLISNVKIGCCAIFAKRLEDIINSEISKAVQQEKKLQIALSIIEKMETSADGGISLTMDTLQLPKLLPLILSF